MSWGEPIERLGTFRSVVHRQILKCANHLKFKMTGIFLILLFIFFFFCSLFKQQKIFQFLIWSYAMWMNDTLLSILSKMAHWSNQSSKWKILSTRFFFVSFCFEEHCSVSDFRFMFISMLRSKEQIFSVDQYSDVMYKV